MKKLFFSIFIGSIILSFVLVSGAWADSTIGVNMSTTGTLTVNKDSATAIQFQDGSGTNVFIFNTSNKRLGIGASPGTTFEAQGTASASYFLSNNAVQFASNAASVAYSRFGTTTTNHANYISAANDLLVSGDVEIRGSASFGSTASVSGIFFMNDGRHRPNANSTTAFRFQNAAGSTDVLTIDTTNTRVGVNAGGTVDTTFEVGGAASVSGRVDFGSNASLSGNFELTAASPLLGLNAGAVIDTNLEVGGTASVSGIITLGDGRIRPLANGTTAFRFQNAAGTTNVLTIDTTNTRVGVNAGGAVDTTFEVGGTASATTVFGVTNIVAGTNTASASGTYVAEFVTSTATTSVMLAPSSGTATKGTCFKMKATDGSVVYARVVGTTWTVNTTSCK